MIRAVTAATCLAATPVLAQQLEVMGTVQAVIDGDETTLWVPYFPEDQEAYAFVTGPAVMATLSVDAFAGTPGEDLEDPRLALGIMRPGPRAVAMDLQLYRAGESDRVYVAEDGLGAFAITGMTVDGPAIGFEFTATAVVTDLVTFKPIPDTDPVSISGRVQVTLRDE